MEKIAVAAYQPITELDLSSKLGLVTRTGSASSAPTISRNVWIAGKVASVTPTMPTSYDSTKAILARADPVTMPIAAIYQRCPTKYDDPAILRLLLSSRPTATRHCRYAEDFA